MTMPRAPRPVVRGAVALPFVLAVATVLFTSQAAARGVTSNAASHLGVEVAVVRVLYPGLSSPLAITITNPFSDPMRLTSLSVSVGDATTLRGQPNPQCDGSSNFKVSQGLDLTRSSVTLPARSTRSLAALGIPEREWPAVEMRSLDTNQDMCQGADFSVTVTAAGTATPRSSP